MYKFFVGKPAKSFFDSLFDSSSYPRGTAFTPAGLMVHELLGHAWDCITKGGDWCKTKSAIVAKYGEDAKDMAEAEIVSKTNEWRREVGLPLRDSLNPEGTEGGGYPKSDNPIWCAP